MGIPEVRPALVLVISAICMDVSGYERIVGGIEVVKHEFPSFAAGIQCGCTILYPQWVMTAAHCLIYKACEKLVVRAAVHSQTGEDWTNAERRNVTKCYMHADYNDSTLENDIALIKLESPFVLNDKIQLITLPPKGYVEYQKCARAVGYGLACTKDQNDCGPVTPRKVDLPILFPDKCWDALNPFYRNDSQICTGYDEGGKSPCYGDSGGPLYVIEDGKHVQVGITSYSDVGACARPNMPYAFTRVSYYLDWIEETIRKDSEDPKFLYPQPKPSGKVLSSVLVQSICQQFSAYNETAGIQQPLQNRPETSTIKCGWFLWRSHRPFRSPFMVMEC